MERINAWNGDNFALAFEEYAPELDAFLRRRLRDVDTAADLVQETFLKAWRSRDSFRGDSSPRTWLYAIAVNVLRDHCRRRRYVGLPDQDVPDSKQIDAASAAAKDEELAFLRERLEQLPDELRETLILVRFQNLSYAEAALALATTENTVRMRLYRAVDRLRAEFEKNGNFLKRRLECRVKDDGYTYRNQQGGRRCPAMLSQPAIPTLRQRERQPVQTESFLPVMPQASTTRIPKL